MNVNNNYFDCIVENNRFRIVESLQKPKQSNAALETLEKIEYIIKNKLSYEPTFNDTFSKYTQDELYNILKEKAVEIKNGFQEKDSTRGSLIRNETRVNAIMASIENSLTPPLALPLNDDVIQEVTTKLEIRDLGNFAQVNRHGRYHVAKTMIERAQKFGFTGDNNITAGKYLQKLSDEIKNLSKDGIIPLPYAAEQGNCNMARLLLSQGVSIDKVDSNGNSALLWAVNKIQKEMVKLLIEHRADPNIMSPVSGYAPLHRAIEREKFDLIELLVNYEKTDINLSNGNLREGYTPLHIAIGLLDDCDRDSVRLLLSHDVIIDKRDARGLSALHHAAIRGYCDMVRLLFSHGAKIDNKDDNGFTALSMAVIKNQKEMVKLLIELGADPNIGEQKDGCTPLHYACHDGKIDFVELLVNYKKTAINLPALDGGTALQIAIITRRKDLIKLLLKHGADAEEVQNISKRTALHYASAKGYCNIARLLFSHGISIDKVNATGNTALHWAVNENQKEMVQLLIEHGANPNLISRSSGYAPLHLACKYGNFDLVELLVNYEKTDINLRNDEHETSLSLLVNRPFPNQNIIKILKDNGGTV